MASWPSGNHPAVQELDTLLQSFQVLKPPGVSKSKVVAATKICMDQQNIAAEPAFVETIIAAFRRSPVSHKLGVLYIIDSVTRQWVAQGAAHAGGVRKMTEILPTLMNELLPVTPDDQKDRLFKLLDIWLSSKTFPAAMLAEFRQKLNTPKPIPTQVAAAATAILANPPVINSSIPQIQPAAHAAPTNATNAGASALLAALSNVPQPGSAALASQAPNPLAALANLQAPPPVNFHPPAQTFAQPLSALAPTSGAPLGANVAASVGNSNLLLALLQPNGQGGVANPNDLATRFQLLHALSQQVSPEVFTGLVAALGLPQPPLPPAPAAAAQVPQPTQPAQPVVPAHIPQHALEQLSSNGTNSNQNGQAYGRQDLSYSSRPRSRSPDHKRRRFSPPNRRDSPTYGSYEPSNANSDSNRMNDQDRRSRGRRGYRNEYRQRSPVPAPREQPGSSQPMPQSNQAKPVGYDPKLPNGKIKVLSRTLFVGGVKTNEGDLKNFFGRYGAVQTCIVNHDKRHAFLKLISHQDAIATKTAVEKLPDSEYRGLFERVGWAVGFGPTTCANYNIGVSEIPIDTLTDADRRWMLSAEYGGTGGKPIATGMVVEEPDIEIGAGPSSKAISRRGGAGRGGGGGGGGGGFHSRRGAGFDSGQPRFRKSERAEPPVIPEPNTIGPPPPVPTFGTPIPGFPMNLR